MALPALISLGVLTLLFVIWAAAMFHMLWRLNKRSLDQLDQTGGGYPTWVGHSLRVFFGALTSDKDRRMRRRILILTGLLTLSIAVHSYIVTRAL
jgi:hypothetical protein